ncbi:hypothetical protein, partial [Sphingomonas adhaesiva]|uniref:hypothetical protein n=1 Tax=Sphingomonas adhaesiva TaxID=28212 RepID=UPI0035C7344A
MATIAPKQMRVGGAELESVLAEASGFTPAKFPGFERLARRIGENAGERLGLNGAFEFELSYSDAEAMSTELVFTAGLEKNVNFGLKIALPLGDGETGPRVRGRLGVFYEDLKTSASGDT